MSFVRVFTIVNIVTKNWKLYFFFYQFKSELNFTIPFCFVFVEERRPQEAITLFMIVYLFDITCQHVQQSWPSPASKWAHCRVI